MKLVLGSNAGSLTDYMGEILLQVSPNNVFLAVDLGSGGLRADFVDRQGSSLLAIRCHQHPLKETWNTEKFKGLLTSEAIDTVYLFFQAIIPIALLLPNQNIVAFATEAVRAAPNKQKLLNAAIKSCYENGPHAKQFNSTNINRCSRSEINGHGCNGRHVC